MTTLTDDLLSYIFDGQPHQLADSMAAWMAASRRFTTFVDTFRDKFRKKRRATHDDESLLDLRLEWETAYLLLQQKSLSLVYEPQQTGPLGRLRGPDFAAAFTTSLTFMVEVTRLRGHHLDHMADRLTDRLADTIYGKLIQLLPQHGHVLIIGVEDRPPPLEDLRAALQRIQQRVERNDAALLQRHGFRDRPTFFNHYQRLSEVLVRGPRGMPDRSNAEGMTLWVNPQAHHPLPSKVRTALYHSHAE